jgi:hypothetical protein
VPSLKKSSVLDPSLKGSTGTIVAFAKNAKPTSDPQTQNNSGTTLSGGSAPPPGEAPPNGKSGDRPEDLEELRAQVMGSLVDVFSDFTKAPCYLGKLPTKEQTTLHNILAHKNRVQLNDVVLQFWRALKILHSNGGIPGDTPERQFAHVLRGRKEIERQHERAR